MPNGNHTVQKANKCEGLTAIQEEEVNSIWLHLDPDGILLGIMLKNDLFQIEKRAFVFNLLPYLYHRLPLVDASGVATAHIALLVFYDELDNKLLLQDCIRKHLFLYYKSDFDTTGMRFSPPKSCVHELDLIETLESLDTQS